MNDLVYLSIVVGNKEVECTILLGYLLSVHACIYLYCAGRVLIGGWRIPIVLRTPCLLTGRLPQGITPSGVSLVDWMDKG